METDLKRIRNTIKFFVESMDRVSVFSSGPYLVDWFGSSKNS